MPYQKCSPILSEQKPVNIFYVWYAELCRRLNSAPAPVVKPAKPKSQTVLNFVADRLKLEEWHPVISALRHDTSLHVIAIRSRLGDCPFLHDVDTEEKLRQMKRRSGPLRTAFILKSLLKSLSCTVRNTRVLTCLEFDGLPMFAQYLEPLMKALQKNTTLKNLSLSRCRIGDEGCRMVCAYLRAAPNIEVLNLASCSLTEESAEHLAKLIKYQQINRYCESWHNSLRYSDPNVHVMRGIKRVTLNNNPLLGDRGLEFILNELDDDLWIKALDMQKCGVTEAMAARIVDLVEYSQSLEIVDFRVNDELSDQTLEKIFEVLKKKNLNPEFQWCSASFTLTPCDSLLYSMSNYTSEKGSSVYKVKSAPLKPPAGPKEETGVRRARTTGHIPEGKKPMREDGAGGMEKKLREMNDMLREEISKRKETEKQNEELKRKLSQIIDVVPIASRSVSVDVVEAGGEAVEVLGRRNGVRKKNGFSNGYGDQAACTILERLVGEEVDDGGCLNEENLLSDYMQEGAAKEQGEGGGREEDKKEGVEEKEEEKQNPMDGGDMTDSQISLLKFMTNLNNNRDNSTVKIINHQNPSKYYVSNKFVKKKM